LKQNAIVLFLHLEMKKYALSVCDDAEKKRNRGMKMKITADEFDRRFDNGEDVLDLMENPQVMRLEELQSNLSSKKVTIEFSSDIYDKVSTKANQLKVNVEDLVKLIVAERVGVL